jgi:hypothetical protein
VTFTANLSSAYANYKIGLGAVYSPSGEWENVGNRQVRVKWRLNEVEEINYGSEGEKRRGAIHFREVTVYK